MSIPVNYFKDVLADIIAIDSPSGYTDKVVEKLKEYTDELGLESYLTNKGNFVVNVPGKSDKTIGIATHVDTLGLMVRGFKADGTLTFTTVGGVILPTLDGEYCKIYTRCGKVYTGTILSNAPASHVFDEAHSLTRDSNNMHVKLDEIVKTPDEVKALGILAGDYICYEPKFMITDNGFIKSRFLDDKLCSALVIAAFKHMKDNNITPSNNICAIFTTNEEVGHGLSHLPCDLSEFLAIDMGCVGDDLSGSEYDVSICAKDASGPYDYEFTSRLIEFAKKGNLNFAVDVYKNYASDVSAARRAGHDIKGAIMGPGVAASHGMERSHMKAVENTFELLMMYLTV